MELPLVRCHKGTTTCYLRINNLCKLQALFFLPLLKLGRFLKLGGKLFYSASYPFVLNRERRTNIRLYEIPYLAGSQLEVGCKEEMRDTAGDDQEGTRCGCVGSSSAGNPAQLPDPPFHPVLYLADGFSKSSAVRRQSQRSSKQAGTVAVTMASTRQMKSTRYPCGSLPCF